MSTGYDTLTVRDFRSYFNGCTAFKCTPEGEVLSYTIVDIHNASEYSDTTLACTTSAILLLNPDGSDSTTAIVPIDTLVTSRAWLLHRFPVQYLTPNGQRLIAVRIEPEDRRMCKGTHMGYLREIGGVLSTLSSKDVPIFVRRALTSGQSINPYSRRAHTWGTYDSRAGLANYADAIAKVLSYGKHPYFYGVAPKPARNCASEVRDMLADRDGMDVSVIVPDSHTAIIKRKADGKKPSAIVIHTGQYVGALTCTPKGGLVLTSTVHKLYPTESGEREVVMRGLRVAMRRLIDCEINVKFDGV